ncbi:protein with Ubiquitin E2 variant domain [Klebsormidium nitens]|uniref:Protein with Ubiquitin E2 variant domain n=1 Tax=Klebsormidium nitens TaxID=105231 RepID=A0A1Y1IDC2_KLENI|nr:protein with Ubiquitin E2 variant domain [Klebsormidium nitens]|eukprot:GAQ87101.1 protein with Ubiquitin E2 variant domain [Klebsormidium nitens]
MATLEAFLEQSASYIRDTLPGLPAYSRVARKQIEQQITQCLEKYRGLALRLDNYAPDGSTSEPTNMALLALEGTIPMSYRDKLYNIPVSIRLPQGFPVSPPACYVLQKNGLVLKPQHTVVTPTGLCNFSRFEKARWDPKHSTMKDQADLMARVFGMEPPLYSPGSAAQQALASAASLSPSFSLQKPTIAPVVPAAVAESKLAARQAWDPKEPTQEELALALDVVETLLTKLEAEDADNEDATDEAFQSLRDEKVKVEDYLKTVRRLAREQYLNRALSRKAAKLKPFLEERDAKLKAAEAERHAAEQAEQAQQEQEAERLRWEEQERKRQEEEGRRMEDERRRAEEERQRAEQERVRAEEERRRQEEEQRRQERERYERDVIEGQRRIAELAAQRAAQEERDRAEQERLWREQQAEQEARRQKEEADRRVAEELERADRERLQQQELQQMQAANTVGVQGGGWPPGGGQFGPYFAPPPQPPHLDHFQPVLLPPPNPPYPHMPPQSHESTPPVNGDFTPVPAYPYQPPNQQTPPPQLLPPQPQYQVSPGPQFYPGPYAPPPYQNQGPVMLGPPPFPYMQPPGPYVQPHAEGAYMMPGTWPPPPPQGYR